jgi:hypothetical protein
VWDTGVLYGRGGQAYRGPMVLLVFLVGAGLLLLGGALYQAHIRRHLPHDLRHVGTEGLPSEAGIRSGELGTGAGGMYGHYGSGSG